MKGANTRYFIAGFLEFLDVDGHDRYIDDMDDCSLNSGSLSQKSISSTLNEESNVPEQVSSLTDLATKVVAKHIACEELEQHNPPLDEGTLKKVTIQQSSKYFSFFSINTYIQWEI